MFSPHTHTHTHTHTHIWELYEVRDVLTNLNVISLQYIHIYQVITWYTLNLHNATCQLYLSKAGKNTFFFDIKVWTPHLCPSLL